MATFDKFDGNGTGAIPGGGAELQGWTNYHGRSSLGIIWSCVLTISICLWVAQHNDLPARNQRAIKFWDSFLYKHHIYSKLPHRPIRSLSRQSVHEKASNLLLCIAFPDLLVFTAVLERFTATKFTLTMHDNGFARWTTKHSFLVMMGAFVEADKTPMDFRRIINLDAIHLDTILDELDEQIDDKIKSDGFVEAAACLQTFWFLVQTFLRLSKGLQVASLELITINYVVCALVGYLAWWQRPRGIHAPITLSLAYENPLYASESIDPEPIVNFWPILQMILYSLAAVAPFIIGVFQIQFTTHSEAYAWFMLTFFLLVILGLKFVALLSWSWSPSPASDMLKSQGREVLLNPWDLMVVVPSRLGLWALAFAGLRSLPKSAYTAVWDWALPHL